AVEQVIDYIENGNIVNSVNLPNVAMSNSGDFRLCVIHKNSDGLLTQITNMGKNIENMESKSKNEYAYTVLDVKGSADGIADKVKAIDGVISVRIIK
ncbi:MAG: 3-phosphoglycerate dehydrogenase, partial [Oscillospiraceae bacterium]|nr:3-phosphoglycerate dehydrogenase [Oscillospiraceae bacterium]